MVDTFQNTPSNTSYETIVTLARSLFSAKALSTNNRPSISSDLGLVGPLLMTISRCTIPQLRWEALALLKAVPRREGMWVCTPRFSELNQFITSMSYLIFDGMTFGNTF